MVLFCKSSLLRVAGTLFLIWEGNKANAVSKTNYQCCPIMTVCSSSSITYYIYLSTGNTSVLARQVRVTVGDRGLCCCVCVTSFER